MQVNSATASSIARLYGSQPAPEGATSTPEAKAHGHRPRTDSVSVSKTRIEVGIFGTVSAGLPGERSDRVATLRAAIANGTYQPDYGALAARLLG